MCSAGHALPLFRLLPRKHECAADSQRVTVTFFPYQEREILGGLTVARGRGRGRSDWSVGTPGGVQEITYTVPADKCGLVIGKGKRQLFCPLHLLKGGNAILQTYIQCIPGVPILTCHHGGKARPSCGQEVRPATQAVGERLGRCVSLWCSLWTGINLVLDKSPTLMLPAAECFLTRDILSLTGFGHCVFVDSMGAFEQCIQPIGEQRLLLAPNHLGAVWSIG